MVSAFPDVMEDVAVRRRRAEISARLFGASEGPTRIGRYRVGKRLGSGALGVVHLAHDDLLGRDVALKLLRAGGEARRAVREAQALARLSHPNVVSVFATGIDGGHAFIAMELVVGETLRAWQAERPWREIIAAYVQAGRGLAAAHEAGIVHRDFKPDNAMIGPDGRVRVLDFGLARGLAVEAIHVDAIVGASSDELARSATGVGGLVGTPAYMAPEQLSGTDADERSDQFAFCVALFEALWGERPFAGRTPTSLLEAQLAEDMRARPPRAPVPQAIHDVLRRGLRADRDRRWPSMTACLDALQHAARPWSPRFIAMTAIVVASTIAAAAVLFGAPTRDCSRGAAELAGIWDDSRKAELDALLTMHAWPDVRSRLDDHANEWIEVWAQTCRESKGEVLVARTRCLDGRRDRLAATVAGLASTAALAKTAPALLDALEPATSCLDPLPASELPAGPDDAVAAVALERRLTDAHAQVLAGHVESGVREYEAALAEARKLDWPPLLAEALYWTASANSEIYHDAATTELYTEAYTHAVATRRDDLAARAATHMVTLVGYEQSKHGEAERWAGLAEAAIDRLGRPNRVEADLFNNLGLVAMDRGDHATARAHYLKAIEVYEQLGAKSGLGVPVMNLAEIAYLAGDYAEVERLLGRAIELRQVPGREDQQDIISLLINRGIVRTDSGRLDEAEADLKRALSISERILGPDAPSGGAALANLGNLSAHRRDHEQALVYFRRAVDTYARGIGRDNEHAAFAQAGAGEALVHLGRVDEGDALLMQSLIEVESLYGSEHEEVGEAAHNIGAARLDAGRPADALPPLQRAAAIHTRGDGPNGLRTARARADIGRALFALGRVDEAVEELEWSLPVLQSHTLAPDEMATIRFALARALAARADRAPAAERITKLATLAADGYRKAGPAWQKELAEVEAFLTR